ncbi:MAG TPA: hypothetical protein VH815_00100, partial [Acidobacteriota bacterium]
MEINPVKDTNLCEIIFTTPDPKLSMKLANAWAEEYVDYSLASQYEVTQKAEELLIDPVKSLQAEIAEKEKLLEQYSLDKQVVKLDKDRSMGSVALENLNVALSTATQDRISKEVHYKDLQSQGKNAVSENGGMIAQLKADYASLERSYAEKSKTYKPDYPEMDRLRHQMDQIKEKIASETDDVYQKDLAKARADYQEALNKETALKNQLEDSKRQSVGDYKKELSYDRLALEIDNKRQLLDSLVRKQNETDISAQLKEKKATTIRIIDRAEMPDGIFKPDIRWNLEFS